MALSDPTALATVPADRRLVDRLYGDGLIDAGARAAALDHLNPGRSWALWTARLLLVLGAALLLAGIVFFFAFNWARLSATIKFGMVELALAACLAGTLRQGFRGLVGGLMLLGAGLLVGVFLAVFGQIYQTGADAYTLFATWAALILPWTVIGCFAPLWALWLVVTNLAVLLFWDQGASAAGLDPALLHIALMALNGGVLALREGLARAAWLGARWTRLILLAPLLVAADGPLVATIVDTDGAGPTMVSSAALGALIHAGLVPLYRFRRPDLWALAMVILSLSVLAEVALARILFAAGDGDDAGLYLLLGLGTLGIFGAAAAILRRLAQTLSAGPAEPRRA